MSEGDNKTLNIVSDVESLRAEFSDIIQVEANQERVILSFLQSLPDQEQKNAQVIKRIAISWPHFARLAQLCNNVLEENHDQVINHLNKFISTEKH